MKSVETKYLLIMSALAENPRATQAELAEQAAAPVSLVNRYLKRLQSMKLLIQVPESGWRITEAGNSWLERARWRFVSFHSPILADIFASTTEELSQQLSQFELRRVVIYGDTPLARILAPLIESAGGNLVGICDEERPRDGVLALEGLASIGFDCFVLADAARAADSLLLRLLTHYAPVINLFADTHAERGQYAK